MHIYKNLNATKFVNSGRNGFVKSSPGQHLPVAALVLAAGPRRQVAADHGGLQPGPLPRAAGQDSRQSAARNPRKGGASMNLHF
jgi:hypothetical protein